MGGDRKDINRWVCPRCNKANIMSVRVCMCGKGKDTSRVIDPAGNPVDDPAYRVSLATWALPALAFLTTLVIVVATLPVSATTAGATAVVTIGVMALPGNSEAAEPPPAAGPDPKPGAGVTGMVPADDGPSIQSNSQPGFIDPGTTTTDEGTESTTNTTTTTTTTTTGDDPHSGSSSSSSSSGHDTDDESDSDH